MKKCTMCGEAIPEPRLLAIPFTLTCSAACARQRDLWGKRQAAGEGPTQQQPRRVRRGTRDRRSLGRLRLRDRGRTQEAQPA